MYLHNLSASGVQNKLSVHRVDAFPVDVDLQVTARLWLNPDIIGKVVLTVL